MDSDNTRGVLFDVRCIITNMQQSRPCARACIRESRHAKYILTSQNVAERYIRPIEHLITQHKHKQQHHPSASGQSPEQTIA